MGRPINHRYFGDLNKNATTQGNQTGGEGVASVTIASPIAATLDAATVTVTFSAPQIAGGRRATGTAVIDGSKDLTGITITDPGTGYTAVPTISIVDSDDSETLSLTSGSGGVTVALTASTQNALSVQARFSGTNRTSGNDIVRQVGSKRFIVKTQDGQRVFTLVTRTPAAAGEMAIVATDADGATYWVSKLYNRTCRLVNKTGTPLFGDGVKVKWGLTTASGVVSITNA